MSSSKLRMAVIGLGHKLEELGARYGVRTRISHDRLDALLQIVNAYEYAGEMTLSVNGRHGAKTRTFTKHDQIAAELEYFARCIREDRDPEPSGWEGLADVHVIQAIMASARYGRSVPVEPIAWPAGAHRPGLGQEIRMPPHGEPDLVDVEQPSK